MFISLTVKTVNMCECVCAPGCPLLPFSPRESPHLQKPVASHDRQGATCVDKAHLHSWDHVHTALWGWCHCWLTWHKHTHTHRAIPPDGNKCGRRPKSMSIHSETSLQSISDNLCQGAWSGWSTLLQLTWPALLKGEGNTQGKPAAVITHLFFFSGGQSWLLWREDVQPRGQRGRLVRDWPGW